MYVHTHISMCAHTCTHIYTHRGGGIWVAGLRVSATIMDGEFLDCLLCMSPLHMVKMKWLHWIISKIPFQHQVLCVFDQRDAIIKTKLLRWKNTLPFENREITILLWPDGKGQGHRGNFGAIFGEQESLRQTCPPLKSQHLCCIRNLSISPFYFPFESSLQCQQSLLEVVELSHVQLPMEILRSWQRCKKWFSCAHCHPQRI